MSDAERAGIDVERLSYTIPVSTANGMTSAARVSIGAIQLGNLERENIGAMVAQKGDLAISLLGMTFLNSLWSFEVRGDRMILTD